MELAPTVSFQASYSPRPSKDTVRYVLGRVAELWPKLVAVASTPDGNEQFTIGALHLPTAFTVFPADTIDERMIGQHGITVVVRDADLEVKAFDPSDQLHDLHPAVVAARHIVDDPIWRHDF